MPMKNVVFADSELVRKTLANMYPQAHQITLIEHGYDNIVGLIDDTYAVRFPRNDVAYQRSQFEEVVLSKLSGLKTVSVPDIIEVIENPPGLVTTFVPGAHLSPAEVKALSLAEQKSFGGDMARFAYEMHSLLPVDEISELRASLALDKLEDDSWPHYFERTLGKAQLPTAVQNKLAKQYLETWKQHNGHQELVVVHDDLHNENLFFKDGHLSGVLDFGDTTVGIPEQDLRHLYRINEDVLKAALDTYSDLSGKQLSLEVAINWAITQELGAYSDRLITNNTQHPAFARACHNLNTWLSEGKWGAGFDITDNSLR